MKIICLAHFKGGVGKSTLGWLLAFYIKYVLGLKVGIIDSDMNQVVSRLNEIRENCGLAGFDILSPDHRDEVDEFLKQEFDYIIVDTGGYRSDMNKYLIGLSDCVLVPLSDNCPDAIGYTDFSSDLKEWGIKNVNVVFSKVNKRKDLSGIIECSDDVTVLNSIVGMNKKQYADPLWKGKTVFDYLNKDAVVCKDDVANLFNELVGV